MIKLTVKSMIFTCHLLLISCVSASGTALQEEKQQKTQGSNFRPRHGGTVDNKQEHQAQRAATSSCQASDFELPEAFVQAAQANFPGPPEIFGTVATIEQGWIPGLALYETPIALRFTHLIDVLMWNCMAVYSENWQDGLTKETPILRAPSTIDDISLHVSSARFMCMVHSFAAVVQDWVPEAPIQPVLEAIGLGGGSTQTNNFVYGFNAQVDACFDIEDSGAANSECLLALASDSCYKPSIVGAVIARQVTEYARRDGWNQYGNLNKDGTPCKANCNRFTDPTDYNNGQSDRKKLWQPLLESNGRGYFTRQEHVTPHISTLGQRVLLSEEDYLSRTVPKPKYKYAEESQLVAERLRETALSDERKMKIEFFDDKLSLAVAIIGAVASLGLSFEQLINFVVGYTASEYDAILLAWKEKIRYDLVRPTTWIQDQMGDDEFETFAGPGQGVQTIPGKNFEAYIRVMPHSEYVSGSACLCQALKDFVEHWLVLNGFLSESSSISVPLPTFLQGSSKLEPGITPSSDLNFVMSDLTELRDNCGESRLWGGMHFSASVGAGYELCEDVGTLGADYAFALADQGNF